MGEVRIDVYRAQGAGGQHVNTTESAVRAVHLPTGIKAEIQDERSQHKNRAKALRVLAHRVNAAERERSEAARSAEKRALLGTGARGERVRTYNFPQDRLTDHRVGVSVRLKKCMSAAGDGLEEVWEALAVRERQEGVQRLLDEVAGES